MKHYFCQWDPSVPAFGWMVDLLQRSFADHVSDGVLSVRQFSCIERQYRPMNRLDALQAWLDEDHVTGTVVILDPDMVFVGPLPEDAAPTCGGQYTFMPDPPRAFVPLYIDADVLRAIMDRWYLHALRVWNDTRNWVSEMIGFAMAANEIGLEVTEREDLMHTLLSDHPNPGPLIHFAYDVPVLGGHFNKWEWSPGSPIPVAVTETPNTARLMFEMLDRYF